MPAIEPDAAPGADAELERLAAVFKLLGDPTRIRLLAELRAHDERCVSDLALATGVRESAVSQALRLLRTANVVSVRRDGRHMRYRLADEHVRALIDTARTHLRHDRDETAVEAAGAECEAPHPPTADAGSAA